VDRMYLAALSTQELAGAELVEAIRQTMPILAAEKQGAQRPKARHGTRRRKNGAFIQSGGIGSHIPGRSPFSRVYRHQRRWDVSDLRLAGKRRQGFGATTDFGFVTQKLLSVKVASVPRGMTTGQRSSNGPTVGYYSRIRQACEGAIDDFRRGRMRSRLLESGSPARAAASNN